MENQSQKTPATAPSTAAPAQAVKPATGAQKVVAPQKQPGQPRVAGSPKASNDVFVRKIQDKIKSSENILVALSRDPSVDEMAAAIGLTLFLDSLQKHTTAIYSGQTPDALQFLQPEGTFETDTDSLRDFIIALNKEKADHLRYKLDGDFVKVYITPYKSNITEDDLEFSYGDFNVNLVLAIGVPSAADLDSALAEHGRIMHDATTVDITIDAPGKFAEIEWSDPGASSVSEMVTKLIFAMQGEDVVLDKETATALLTGIVAATGRFSNDRTNSNTMQLASKLMAMGADQQLISAHVMDNTPGVTMEGAVVMPVVDSVQGQNIEQAQVQQPAGPSQADLAAAASAAVNEAVTAAAANAAVAARAVSPFTQTGERKDYAQMMAQALEESGEANPVAAPLVSTPATTQTNVAASVNAAVQPAVSANPAAQVAPVEETQGPELVAKPNGVTLPPPPEPVPTADMMPPALPTAQTVTNNVGVAQGTPAGAVNNAPTAATRSDAFQIPGMN